KVSRTFAIIFIVVVIAAGLLGFYVGRITAPSPPKLPEVVIAYSLTAQGFCGPMLAKELEFFEKHGIHGTVLYISGATQTQAAIMGGSVHFGVGPGVASVASSQLAGEDLILIMVPGFSGPVGLWARPGITKPQDLIGKKIAVTTLSSPHHMYVLHALKVWNIDPSQVSIVAMANAPALEAMKAGTMDSALLGVDWYPKAQEYGCVKLFDLWDFPGGEKFFFAPVAARRSWVEAHPRETVNALKAMIEGWQYYISNKDSLEIINKYTGTDIQQMSNAYEPSIKIFKRGLNYVPTREELVFNLEMNAIFDQKLLNADVDKLWDLTYFKQALTELGMLK
ncbi:MAG: ABC transporter substrate-binding protein, partial [Candidatus Bathyarchaeia archaeon]